jgi:hypothetical protein
VCPGLGLFLPTSIVSSIYTFCLSLVCMYFGLKTGVLPTRSIWQRPKVGRCRGTSALATIGKLLVLSRAMWHECLLLPGKSRALQTDRQYPVVLMNTVSAVTCKLADQRPLTHRNSQPKKHRKCMRFTRKSTYLYVSAPSSAGSYAHLHARVRRAPASDEVVHRDVWACKPQCRDRMKCCA